MQHRLEVNVQLESWCMLVIVDYRQRSMGHGLRNSAVEATNQHNIGYELLWSLILLIDY